MGEGDGAAVRRVVVADARGQGGHLRVTWHPDKRVVVLSHWRDGICQATTPVALDDIPDLIQLLVGALGDAAGRPGTREIDASGPAASPLARAARRLRALLARRKTGGGVVSLDDRR